VQIAGTAKKIKNGFFFSMDVTNQAGSITMCEFLFIALSITLQRQIQL